MTYRRGRAAIAVVALLSVASCSDDTDDGLLGGVGVDPSVTIAPAPGEEGQPPPGGPVPTGGVQVGPLPTGVPGTDLPTQPTLPPLDASGPVGSFAPSLLRPDRSQRLVIEIQADDRAEPAQTTTTHVAAELADVTGKPVEVVQVALSGGGTRDWTAAQLIEAADRGAVTAQGGGVAVLRLLFVHGTFEGDDGVLGVAVRGDLAAIFVDQVVAAGGLLGAAGGVQAAVTTHEVGHLLGLVDLYLHTGRADPEHPGHSANQRSVMYWAVETDLVAQLLGADPPKTFDDDDRADLAAIAAGA